MELKKRDLTKTRYIDAISKEVEPKNVLTPILDKISNRKYRYRQDNVYVEVTTRNNGEIRAEWNYTVVGNTRIMIRVEEISMLAQIRKDAREYVKNYLRL